MILMIKIRVSPVGDNRYLNPRSRNIYFSLATVFVACNSYLLLETDLIACNEFRTGAVECCRCSSYLSHAADMVTCDPLRRKMPNGN